MEEGNDDGVGKHCGKDAKKMIRFEDEFGDVYSCPEGNSIYYAKKNEQPHKSRPHLFTILFARSNMAGNTK